MSIEGFEVKDFGKILKKNALAVRRVMLKSHTDCMRVYDRNIATVPLTVDLYASYARITDYSDGLLDERDLDVCVDIVSRMLYVTADHVIMHTRLKREGREQHDAVDEEECEVEVKENGLTFTVELRKRIDTGLFLDHMLTRLMVKEVAQGATVLNLFSYTGSFSVYAASGGAEKVVSVDMSPTYSKWCEKNLRDNGFFGSRVPCVTDDAYAFVVRALQEGQKYDLIIFDPPSFSNSRRMKKDFDVQRDHVKWFRLLNGLLEKGSLLLFSTNLSGFKIKGDRIQGFELKEITQDVQAPGFSRRRKSTRSWILEKEHDVEILAVDMADVVPTVAQGADDATETVAQEKKPAARKRAPRKVKEKVEVEEVAEAMVVEVQEEVPVVRKRAPRKAKKEVEAETTAVVDVEEEKPVVSKKAPRKTKKAVEAEAVEAKEEEIALPAEEGNELLEASSEAGAAMEQDGMDDGLDGDENTDDSFLTLDWGEEPALSPAAKKEKTFSKTDSDDGHDNPRGRKAFEERRGERKYGDRPRYNDDRAPRPFDRSRDDRPRDNSDRPRYNDDRGPRSFDRGRDDRPRYNSDRPRYNDDRAPRPFDRSRDDRPRYNADKPRYNDDRGPRSFDRSRDDRPRYNADKPRYNDDRGPRSFDRSRDDRPRYNADKPRYNDDRGPRSFDRSRDDRPKYNADKPRYNDDRGPRSFDRSRDDRPRYNSDRPRSDRPGYDRPRFSRDEKGGPASDRPRTDRKKAGPRPYGFEFAASRNREDEDR